MNTIAVAEAPTAASVWLSAVGSPIGDELLEWPPASTKSEPRLPASTRS